MELVGAWLRQLWRAGTAAAIVPIAIVAALVVAVAGAGLGGVGSLGQLFTGPELSPLLTDGAQADREGGRARERDLALVAPPTIVAAVRPASEEAAAAPEPAPAPAPQRVLPRRPGPSAGLPPPPVRPPPPPPQAAPPPPPAGPTARDRASALVGGLGEAVDGVGAVVGEVIGNLGEATGEILGGPPPAR